MIRAAILMAVATTAAHAALCARIEYVEARDWPVAQVERAYCDAGQSMRRGISDALEAEKVGDSRASRAILAMSNLCAEQQAMFGRVIENVHKRPLPVCK